MYKAPILLKFKYTVSKGQNTYGYNIVSLYANGEKVASTCGGGYDMKGTVLANYIIANFKDRLKALVSNHGSMDDGTGFYGLSFHDKITYESHKTYKEGDNIYLDGACGISAIERIAKEINLDLTSTKISKNDYGYFLTDNK